MNTIDARTLLYCVFGSPVGHSKSPVMHNMLFAEYGMNAAYLAFEPEDVKSGIAAVRSLGIQGVSVTIPFKEKILAYLDEIDEQALRMGAVNTVVHHDSGSLKGYNTDCYGAVAPLRRFGIAGKRVGIIGAGGAARSAGFGMIREQGKVTVINRSSEKGKKLAAELDCSFLKLEDMDNREFDMLINTTPSGMYPNTEQSPVPDHVLRPGMVVMDMVYNPVETRLLRRARQRGCHTISGIEMFICQGAKQFELWTGIFPSVDKLRQAMMKETV